ncbi:hypothetical protein KDA14_01395 [Candidatus Saccharibacteria bacterium]|nr:hypothetical protein [Candidatus Saccharibacteria bacterium]
MYRVDRRTHRHRRARRNFIVFIIIVGSITLIYSLLHIRIAPKQNIKNAPSVSKNYQPGSTETIAVSKPLFTLNLPSGWKEAPVPPKSDDPKFSFRSPTGEARLLDIYIDDFPTPYGINKAIVLSLQGNKVTHDSVSDNCTTFTDGSKRDDRTGLAPAKWQGVDFQCDMAKSARAVVGTISKEGQNFFLTEGATTGQHKFFIAYTDNNINPDYTVFYKILESLTFK